MIRNTIEVPVYEGTPQERTIGFRTTTYAWGMSIREAGAVDEETFVRRLRMGDLTAAAALFYGSYVQYQGWKNRPVDMNIFQLSEILEDIGEEKLDVVMKKMMESYLPKNSQPPQKAGEQPQQQSMIGNTSQ